jgi:hypothetical protein
MKSCEAFHCHLFFAAPAYEDRRFGFRIASVPEPATFLLLGLGGLV